MEPRLTLLGRSGARWQVRVEVADAAAVRGLTVGLHDADGRPLGPGVVCPVPAAAGRPHVQVIEVGGPARLPVGAVLQCLVDVEAVGPSHVRVEVDRRRGVHAWLHADARLEVPTETPPTSALDAGARAALARAWSCLATPSDGVAADASRRAGAPVEAVRPASAAADPSTPDASLLDMLRDEFGVDVDDMADDLRDAFTRAPGSDDV